LQAVERGRFDWVVITKKGNVRVYENPLSEDSEYDIDSFLDLEFKSVEHMVGSNSKEHFLQAKMVLDALNTKHKPVKTAKTPLSAKDLNRIVTTRDKNVHYDYDKKVFQAKGGNDLFWGVNNKECINQIYTHLCEIYTPQTEWEKKNPILHNAFLDHEYQDRDMQMALYYGVKEGSYMVLDGMCTQHMKYEDVMDMPLSIHKNYGIAVVDSYNDLIFFIDSLKKKFYSLDDEQEDEDEQEEQEKPLDETDEYKAFAKKLTKAVMNRPRWYWLRVVSKKKYEYVQDIDESYDKEYFVTGEKTLVDWAVKFIKTLELVKPIVEPECGTIKLGDKLLNKLFDMPEDKFLCIDNNKYMSREEFGKDMYGDLVCGWCTTNDKYKKIRNKIRKTMLEKFMEVSKK